MSKEKINSVRKLLTSSAYILITDSHTVIDADFRGVSGALMKSSVKHLIKELEKTLKKPVAKSVRKKIPVRK